MAEAAPRPGLATRLFGIDLRSLALYRIALASVILIDLGLRAPFIAENYTDAGVLPRSVLGDVAPYFSLHLLGGGYAYQAALFALAAVFAGMLLVGYRTRLATIVTWLLLTSLHHRNYFLGNTGDLTLRLLTIWGIFLPLGACWSVDARRAERPEAPALLSPATVALLLQFVVLYLVAGLVKTGPEWSEGTAIQLVLHQTYWSRELSERLLEHPDLLATFSKIVVPFEVFGPFLMFVPVFTAPVRLVTIAAFVLFQLGLATNIQLHWFPVASTVALLPFLPTAFWERLRPWRGTPGAPIDRGRLPWLQHACVLSLLAYGAYGNWTTLDEEREVPEPLWSVGEALGFRQLWDLYAPSPRVSDPAYGVLGRLADGTLVVLATAPTPEHAAHSGHSFRRTLAEIGFRPESSRGDPRPVASMPGHAAHWQHVQALHRTTHFKGALFQLARGYRHNERRQAYLGWICRRWNRERPPEQRLEESWLFLMERPITLEGWGPAQTHLLAHRVCEPS